MVIVTNSSTVFELAAIRPIVPTLVSLGSPSFRRKLVELIPWRTLHRLKDIVDVMDETSRTIMVNRKEELLEAETGTQNIISTLRTSAKAIINDVVDLKDPENSSREHESLRE